MDNFKQHFVNAENSKNALATYRKFQRFTETLGYKWIERSDEDTKALLISPPPHQTVVAVWGPEENIDKHSIRIHKSGWPSANGNPQLTFDYPRSLVGKRIEDFQSENEPMPDTFIHNFINNIGVVQGQHEELILRPDGSFRKVMVSKRVNTPQDVFNDMRKGFKELEIVKPCIHKRRTREEAIPYLTLLGLSHRNLMKLKHRLNMPIDPKEITDEVMVDLL